MDDQREQDGRREAVWDESFGLGVRDPVDAALGVLNGVGVGRVGAPFEVFPCDQAHEVWVLGVGLAEPGSEFGEVLDVDRRGLDDLLDEFFPDGVEQLVLASEVVVDLGLVGVRCGGDTVDAGSGDPVCGELRASRVKEPSPGRCGIPGSRLNDTTRLPN